MASTVTNGGAAVHTVAGGKSPGRSPSVSSKGSSPRFSKWRKKSGKSHPKKSSRAADTGDLDDSVHINHLVWDDPDFSDTVSLDGMGSVLSGLVGNGTMTLGRKAGSALNGAKSSQSSSPKTPNKLVPRRDTDMFHPGERSPARLSVLSSSSLSPNPSPLASVIGSSVISPKYLMPSEFVSPPPSRFSDGRDSTTPTQDLVDTSLLIQYQHHLIWTVGETAAWQQEESVILPLNKSVPGNQNEKTQSEGSPTPGALTEEDRPPPHLPSADGDLKTLMNKYNRVKRTAFMSRSPPPDVASDDDTSPSRHSLYSESHPVEESGMRPRSHTVSGSSPFQGSTSEPTSPSLLQRRERSRQFHSGINARSVSSLPDAPTHARSGSLSSSASSLRSEDSFNTLGHTDFRSYRERKSSVSPHGSSEHRRLKRVSGKPDGPRRMLPSEVTSPSPRNLRSTKSEVLSRPSPPPSGRIVRREGHVRIKSSRPLSQASDDAATATSRPTNRVSVSFEPFSPLGSPSPHTFFSHSVAPSCLPSPPATSPGDVWHWASSVERRQIDFVLPTGTSVRLTCHGGKSVAQVKSMLWARLSEEGILLGQPQLRDLTQYSLKYCLKDKTYELFDELQMMQTLQVWEIWKSHKLDVGRLLVTLRRVPKAKEKRLALAISHLIGGGLQHLQSSTPEVDWTRRSLVGVRLDAVRSRDRQAYSMEAVVSTVPIPSHIKQIFSTGSGMMTLEVFFMGQPKFKKIDVFISMKPAEIMADIFHHFKKEAAAYKADSTVEDYVLRACSQKVYITGEHLVVNFSFVRECLSKGRPIRLAFVPILDMDEEEPEVVVDEEFVDETSGLSARHHQLTLLNKPHDEVFVMSMWDIGQNFRVRVIGLSRLTAGLLGRGERVAAVHVEAGIYHAGQVVVAHQRTTESPYRSNVHWYQWLEFELPTHHLPQAARICFSVMMTIQRGRQVRGPVPVYWVNMNVINFRSLLQQGSLALSMWPCSSHREVLVPAPEPSTDTIDGDGSASQLVLTSDGSTEASKCGMRPTGSSAVNSQSFDCPTLTVELDTYAFPVACPSSGWPCTLPQSPAEPSVANVDYLDRIVSNSAIIEMSQDDKKLVFHHREYLSKHPKALVKFLMAIDWADLQQVQEAHRYIHKWEKIAPEDALELLDFKFADKVVRSLAVSRLEALPDTELTAYLLQLVQVLKFESYHDSALARFLLTRALKSKRIGHFFFWYLRAELERPDYRQRFGLLLEAYLKGCGRAMLKQFQKQNAAVIALNDVARRVKFAENRSEPIPPVQSLLAETELPDGFSPAFDCSIQLGKLNVDACKVMTSKKKPLWLEFVLEDVTRCSSLTKQVIFKQGDDLRQDMLTLQVIRLMDQLWQNDGLDLYMIPYGCMATGLNSGMIEVVADAKTIAKIQQEEGGGVLLPKGFAPFKKETVCNWLKKTNPKPEDLAKAVERFTLSCAGYSVATYVLGIGDRHNDNIMLRRDGNLFHIDFGHFLGNIKYFNVFGKKVKRERLPFILTPDFVYVMTRGTDTDLFPLFQRTCARAFNILRRHANVLINLFAMMKLTGIPELRGTEDLSYLHNVLRPDFTDADAADHFHKLIDECYENSDSVQANWALHIIGQQLAKS